MGKVFGQTVSGLKKKCFTGVEHIESVRCIKRSAYQEVNGHNEKMVFSEDKDLDIRIRNAGFKIGRTQNLMYHNEGNLSLIKTLKKKFFYSNTINIFAKEHSKEFKWQSNLLNRYLIYLKNWEYLFNHPLLYFGMIFMKTAEFTIGGVGFLINKIRLFLNKVRSIFIVFFNIKNPWILIHNFKIFNGKISKVYLKNGMVFKFRDGENDLKEIIKINIFNEYPTSLLNKVPYQGSLIDLGAHIGAFSILAGRLRPDIKIYSIEPIDSNYNLLNDNIKLNNLSGNVFPLKLGISNYNGVGFFDSFEGKDSSYLTNKRINNGAYQKCEVSTLKNLLKKIKLKNVSLIKIDVEGEEYKILKESRKILSNINLIIMEYHMILNKKMIYPLGEEIVKTFAIKNNFSITYQTKNIILLEIKK